MTDTVFRTKAEPVGETLPEGKEEPVGSQVEVEVPYLDSSNFLTDYFNLGTEWKDHDASFSKELDGIDSYLKSKITEGEIGNSQKAVTDILKGMEKLNNLSKEGRSVIRLEVLANYIEFLRKNDNLKSNLKRYAHS